MLVQEISPDDVSDALLNEDYHGRFPLLEPTAAAQDDSIEGYYEH